MKTEKEYEELFISCVKRQGGHAFKIKMSTISGLPDLYCVMPGYSPVLLEAKLIKDVNLKFKRTIRYSKLQVELLKNCNKVNSVMTAFGLVFVKDHDGTDVVILMDPEVPTITHNDLHSLKHGYTYIVDGAINVNNLFHAVVPKLQMNFHEKSLDDANKKIYGGNAARATLPEG